MGRESGVYMQVKLGKKSAGRLSNIVWCCLDGVTVNQPDKFLKPDDYHATILYSRQGDPAKINVNKSAQHVAHILDIEQWDTNDKVLVCTLDSPSLQKRHAQLMAEHDLQWDYDDYKPHITLCYDLKFGPRLLETLKDKLVGLSMVLVDETVEALDEDAT